MIINYSNEPAAKDPFSIFLAGPTPRKKEVPSWRPDALKVLEILDFQGTVYIPEYRDGFHEGYDYIAQVEWEYKCLENAGVICFWIPRKLPDMPAFTTNVEFGRYIGKGNAFYGRPDWAEKKGYLDWLYGKATGRAPCVSMEELFKQAINKLMSIQMIRLAI
jgi:hypothetical protein